MKSQPKLFNICRWVAAIILLQTLFFKFSAAPVSVHIFSVLGIEPWGRIATAVVELLAGGLLIYRPTAWIGSLLSLGLMLGAIVSHLLWIGIDVEGDHGKLFLMAVVTLLCAIVVLNYDKNKMVVVLKNIR